MSESNKSKNNSETAPEIEGNGVTSIQRPFFIRYKTIKVLHVTTGIRIFPLAENSIAKTPKIY